MNEIDKINNPQKEISESDKTYIKSRLNDIRLNTIYISSKHNINNKNNINNNKNNINNNKINNNKININNKNDIKKETSKNPFDLMKKELALNMKLMKKNKLEKNNIFLSIKKNFYIINPDKRRNNSLDDQKSRIISLAKPIDPYKYLIENNNDINNKKKNSLIFPDNKLPKIKEISPNYEDEFETENTICYKNKELKMITCNLLLKKIITTDFLDKNIKVLYYFSQQCFCFIQKEILFQKIINCYSFYKKLDTPFNQIKKLIYFLNALVIEMYEYYISIPLDDKGVQLIKKFYNNLQDEINVKLGIAISNNVKNSSLLERFLYGNDDKSDKKISNKIDEKRKIMGKMVDRLKSNQNNKNGIINKKEETSDLDKKNKNSKNKDKKDEEEILEEIKKIIPLFEYNEPNWAILSDTKNNLFFYKLKSSLIDSKIKKKKNAKKSLKTQRTTSYLKNEKNTKKSIKQKNFYYTIDYEPKEIGEVLINISKDLLSKIKRKELYKAIFLKKIKNKACPNVMECINKFNKLTSFIIEDILSYDFPKDRARIIEAWLRVAEYLKIRKDHNDCVAIYSALKHYIISGLKLTMKELKSKQTKALFKELGEYCTFEGNYKNIREEFINCVENNEFYVPYLGMLLRDLSFFEGNSEYLKNGDLINIEKIEKIQITIDNFFKFTNITDVLNKNSNFPPELDIFNNLEFIKEDDLDILANKLEPKFMIGDMPKKRKRLTIVDKKYFSGKFNSVISIKCDEISRNTVI